MHEYELSVSGVCFRYKKSSSFQLQDINLHIGTGVHGLLGPNGAGKTTLMRILAGIKRPTSGQLALGEISSEDANFRSSWQRKVGYLPQDAHWFGSFTVSDFLEYFARLRRVPRTAIVAKIDDLLAKFDLLECRNGKLSDLSGGQLQRAMICQALVHDPDFLILDEPTATLDPLQRIQLKSLIKELGKSRIVLFSTHLIEDIVECADSVIVLARGETLWDGGPCALQDIGRAVSGEDAVSATQLAEAGFVELLSRTSRPRGGYVER